MLLRERPRTSAGLLPAPAPLPSLAAALSRRAAIFGAVASTGALMASTTQAASANLATAGDAGLVAMAADLCATLDGAAYAFDPVSDEGDQNRRLGRANALQLDIAALPAMGLADVLATGSGQAVERIEVVIVNPEKTSDVGEMVPRAESGAHSKG